MMYASCLGENKHGEPGCFASARVCLSTGRRLPAALGRPELLGDPWPNSASLGGHGGLGVSQGCWLGCDAAWGCSVPSSCWDRLWHGPVLEFLAGKAPSAAAERVPGDAPTAWAYVATLLLLLLLRPSSWPPPVYVQYVLYKHQSPLSQTRCRAVGLMSGLGGQGMLALIRLSIATSD